MQITPEKIRCITRPIDVEQRIHSIYLDWRFYEELFNQYVIKYGEGRISERKPLQ